VVQFFQGPVGAGLSARSEVVMANVQVIQRNAHLAGAVQMSFIDGREGKIAKAVLTAISNTRRGSGDARQEEATALQWTLWGKQAENAAEYLGKGSHVNIVGRLQNNNYEKEGATVYAMSFTAEEIDYLDTKADAQARSEGRAPAAPEEGGRVDDRLNGRTRGPERKARADRQAASAEA
jgi:single-strand DNA-binding protein